MLTSRKTLLVTYIDFFYVTQIKIDQQEINTTYHGYVYRSETLNFPVIIKITGIAFHRESK